MDISPDKQNIDRVFSNTAYYIDFYQRDYRWTDEPVLRLLDDIFFKFKELRTDSYKSKLDMTALKEKYGLDLEALDQFGPDQLEARHKLLFKLVGIIWV